MSNPQKQKGTDFENHVLAEYVIPVFPDAERRAPQGTADYGDYTNVRGWLLEARNRKTWALPDWIRGVYAKMMRLHDNRAAPWAIFFKADKRGPLFEDYVVIPARIWSNLMKDRNALMQMRREHARWKTGPEE
jgi:hypothetical protein